MIAGRCAIFVNIYLLTSYPTHTRMPPPHNLETSAPKSGFDVKGGRGGGFNKFNTRGKGLPDLKGDAIRREFRLRHYTAQDRKA